MAKSHTRLFQFERECVVSNRGDEENSLKLNARLVEGYLLTRREGHVFLLIFNYFRLVSMYDITRFYRYENHGNYMYLIGKNLSLTFLQSSVIAMLQQPCCNVRHFTAHDWVQHKPCPFTELQRVARPRARLVMTPPTATFRPLPSGVVDQHRYISRTPHGAKFSLDLISWGYEKSWLNIR